MIGPRRITLVVCDGCPALATKSVRPESPVHVARCQEADGRLINAHRQVYDAPPAWCPAAPALAPSARSVQA